MEEEPDAEVTRQAVEREGKRCILIAGDVADPKFFEHAVRCMLDEFRQLDALVDNAAFRLRVKKLEDLDEEHFDRTLKTNLYGCFHRVRSAAPRMKPGSVILNSRSATGIQRNGKLFD